MQFWFGLLALAYSRSMITISAADSAYGREGVLARLGTMNEGHMCGRRWQQVWIIGGALLMRRGP
jgi:hypothetical protein